MATKRTLLPKAFLFISLIFSAFGDAALAQENENFINPIFAGFYPDPSITRVGEDYYLVHSTFAYFPGVPVFHSKDLVNWKQLGHVLNRPEQLDLDSLGVSRGIFAPTISHHKGTFYMITTLVDNGGNFVVTTTDPAGPWSNPYWLPGVSGIDPSLFFDEDGKAFIVYNSEAPGNNPQYDGHRTIRMIEFNPKKMQTVGSPIILVNGGVDFSKKPVWIEGPHVYKKDGFYYLMAAEGGTSVDHSEVILRSKKVKGPYVPYEHNPILTQRHLPAERPYPVSATGHADLVETQKGEWWAVFLATRPYDQHDSYNIGRETFLAPVSWKEGWPVINPDFEEVQYAYQRPDLPAAEKPEFPLNGNFVYREDFQADSLLPYWLFLRTPRTKWHGLKSPAGSLTINLRPESLTEKGNPSFITRRQQHIHGSASVKMHFEPATTNEFAGIVAFQNDAHFYAIGKTLSEMNEEVVQLVKAEKNLGHNTVVLAEKKLAESGDAQPLYLKIAFNGDKYAFYYGTEEGEWNLLLDEVDGTYLSTRLSGGFVGTTLGMYGTSQGDASSTKASFDWFEYEGNDPVYKEKSLLNKKNP